MIEQKLEITNLIAPLINTYKTFSNEWKHIFEIGISDYLHSQTEKYYFTNTFIHRSEKVKFDDIYYPVSAGDNKLTTNFAELEVLFKNYKNITLVGSAGSGKTTVIKYIFLHSIRTTKKIPILIELRFLNEFNGDFEKLICEKILKSKIKPSETTFKKALESGSFLFLLDGYDEVFSNKKQEINRQIELFVDAYSKNNFFITTRPGSGIESFPRFHNFNVLPLDDNDVIGFIEKIVESQERKIRILEIINDTKNQNYLEYLRNPLLLSMFILAFESHPEIPSRKSSFYRNVFDTLYSKHDGITKNSFPREKLTKLEREEFEKILNIFSYLTMLEGYYSFTNELLTDKLNIALESINLTVKTENLIYDLQTTISILVLDGFEYHFPHRSMQEYFAARFIENLPSDKKEKAYTNLSDVLIKSSTDHSFNLWSICYELDQSAFTKYFLIPQLKLYLNELKSKSELGLLTSYLYTIEGALYYDYYDLENRKRRLMIYRHQNLNGALIEFCASYDYREFAYFTEKLEVKNSILEILDDIGVNELDLINLTNNTKIMSILVDNNICEIIKRYKKSISLQIKSFETQIKITDRNLDSLLGR